MKSTCKTCGRNCEGEYCFQHKPRKPLSRMSSLPTKKLDKSSDNRLKMNELFMSVWSARPHKSEVSGEWLGKEPLTVFFHHILPKEKYPQAALAEDNIILLTLEEHDTVEKDIYKYDEVNRRRDALKLKYATT